MYLLGESDADTSHVLSSATELKLNATVIDPGPPESGTGPPLKN